MIIFENYHITKSKSIYAIVLLLNCMVEFKKTTVTFPAYLLKALRMYMARENLGLHDQSKVVADALREYLIKNGIPVSDNDKTELQFEVTLKSE